MSDRQVVWCCGVFKGWFDEAGERGFGIAVDRFADGDVGFFLQHRSIERDDEGPKTHPRPLSLVGQINLRYCPWCGANLSSMYGAVADQMRRPGLVLQS